MYLPDRQLSLSADETKRLAYGRGGKDLDHDDVDVTIVLLGGE